MAYDTSERTMIQVPVPPDLVSALEKRLAKLKSRVKSTAKKDQPRLNDIYDEAVSWFLANFKKDPTLLYLVSPRKEDTGERNKYRSMWIDSVIIEKARKRAEKDGVSVNRVVYSALQIYLTRAKAGEFD